MLKVLLQMMVAIRTSGEVDTVGTLVMSRALLRRQLTLFWALTWPWVGEWLPYPS